jgi:CBS domain containing-hemolysin-like protein
LIVSLARREGELLTFEEQVIHRVLDLEGVSVREIMVPRNQIVSVSCDDPIPEILRKMLEHQYSRVPVYEGQPEHIIGVLHYKDLLKLHQDLLAGPPLRPAASRLRLRALLRKPPVVPETKPVSEMIEEFRRARVHMAIVVDEFGTVSGLVTLEDVLEQLFGEIEDEHDLARHAPSPQADMLELDGATSIRDLETQYGIELPSNAGFETLAGFLLYRLGYIPKPGDSVTFGGRRYTVLEMDRNRIALVRIERVAPAPAD